jgi:hypothetical protein
MLRRLFHLKNYSIVVVLGLNMITTAPAESAEGTLSTSTVPAAKVSLSQELQAEVFLATIENRDKLLADYRKLLEVYFQLKKRSSKPNEFQNAAFNASMPGTVQPRTTETLAEFGVAHYDEFKVQLEADPRLKGNIYVAKMRAYGTGHANDVFHRVAASTLEELGIKEGPIFRQLIRNVSSAIQAVGMLEANEVFKEVSRQNGYPLNGLRSRPDSLAEWRAEIQAKEAELRPTLMKLAEKKGPATSIKGGIPSSAAACAADYGKL